MKLVVVSGLLHNPLQLPIPLQHLLFYWNLYSSQSLLTIMITTAAIFHLNMVLKSYQLVEHDPKKLVNACQDIHKALHHPWASPLRKLVNSSHHQVIVKRANEALV